MDLNEFNSKMNNVFAKAHSLLEKKNADYSGFANPFKNLSMCEAAGLATTEEGILIRMLDKIGRVSTLTVTKRNPKIDESIEDTLIDLMNYAALLIVYRQGKKDSYDNDN